MEIKGTISYKRIKKIGEGQGMNSTVYLVTDPQLGDAEFAVKEINKIDLGNDVSNFWVESSTMNDVGHPNIVQIRCAFQTADKICLEMDYYKNGSLADRTNVGPIPPLEVLRIGQGILSGTASIHAAGYLHFDIKPSNVFIDDNNRPLVADFGQTRKIGPHGITPRPPMYVGGMPPECYSGVGVQQSDVYHIGLTLYRAANGDKYFNDQIPNNGYESDGTPIIDHATLETMTLRGTFPNRNKFLPHVPRRLRTVIRKSLLVDPAERYASAEDMAEALGKVKFSNNWETEISNNGKFRWTAEQPTGTNLVVDCIEKNQAWDIEIHTERNGNWRGRSKQDWKTGLSLKDAFKDLKSLFESME